ncbi:hypothetical protein TcWFU_004052 [Taenia crassiceps]|uniref:Uncharacterized protein n=1 Tax=Taenia crassiceps TaxID=6207 RepID=A0ABR4QK94_9CEST
MLGCIHSGLPLLHLLYTHLIFVGRALLGRHRFTKIDSTTPMKSLRHPTSVQQPTFYHQVANDRQQIPTAPLSSIHMDPHLPFLLFHLPLIKHRNLTHMQSLNCLVCESGNPFPLHNTLLPPATRQTSPTTSKLE